MDTHSAWSPAMTYTWYPTFSVPFLPLNVPTPAHSPHGQWVPVGKREALNGKNFYKFLMPSSSHAP